MRHVIETIFFFDVLKHFHTGNMDGGMDMFEKQFDGVVKVKLLAFTLLE